MPRDRDTVKGNRVGESTVKITDLKEHAPQTNVKDLEKREQKSNLDALIGEHMLDPVSEARDAFKNDFRSVDDYGSEFMTVEMFRNKFEGSGGHTHSYMRPEQFKMLYRDPAGYRRKYQQPIEYQRNYKKITEHFTPRPKGDSWYVRGPIKGYP